MCLAPTCVSHQHQRKESGLGVMGAVASYDKIFALILKQNREPSAMSSQEALKLC